MVVLCETSSRVTNVFYEQYLTIVPEGLFNISMCLLPTFVVCCLLLGLDIRSGLLNLITIIMIVVDTVGVMTLWGIDYNAVALINLVTVRTPGSIQPLLEGSKKIIEGLCAKALQENAALVFEAPL